MCGLVDKGECATHVCISECRGKCCACLDSAQQMCGLVDEVEYMQIYYLFGQILWKLRLTCRYYI